MAQQIRNYKIKGLSSVQIRDLILHTGFYWARVFSSVALRIVNISLFSGNILLLQESDGLLLKEELNLFAFYLITSSVIHENLFAYYVSIIFLFHNAILAIILPVFSGDVLPVALGEWIITGILCFLYVSEGIISLTIAYLRRNSFNFDLFKKIGLNDKINNAFAVRKCLETLGIINIFLALSTGNRFISPAVYTFGIIASLSLGHLFLTIIQQLFISIKINEEIIWMRKTAICITIIKIPLPILMIIYRESGLINENFLGLSIFFDFFFVDQIIISIIILYYLIIDLNYCGSGLKSYFRVKTKSLNLS